MDSADCPGMVAGVFVEQYTGCCLVSAEFCIDRNSNALPLNVARNSGPYSEILPWVISLLDLLPG